MVCQTVCQLSKEIKQMPQYKDTHKPISQDAAAIASQIGKLGDHTSQVLTDKLEEDGHPLYEHLRELYKHEATGVKPKAASYWDDSRYDGHDGEPSVVPASHIPGTRHLGDTALRFLTDRAGRPTVQSYNKYGKGEATYFQPPIKTYLSLAHHIGVPVHEIRHLHNYFKTPRHKRPGEGMNEFKFNDGSMGGIDEAREAGWGHGLRVDRADLARKIEPVPDNSFTTSTGDTFHTALAPIEPAFLYDMRFRGALKDFGQPVNEFSFSTNDGEHERTNKGNALEVMQNVGGVLLHHLSKPDASPVHFTGEMKSGHAKLYDYIARNIKRYIPDHTGYHVETGPGTVSRHYIIAHDDHASKLESALSKNGVKFTKLSGSPRDVAKLARTGVNSATLDTKNSNLRVTLAKRILAEAQLRGRVSQATAIDPSRSRASVYQTVHHAGEPDAVRYAAAWYGLLAKEPRQTIFHVDPQGDDRVHVLTTNATPDVFQRAAGIHGITNATKLDNHYHIFDPAGQLTEQVRNLGSQLNAIYSSFRGTGHRIGTGSGSDADARESYRTVIEQYEKGGNSQPAAE
jgi:hypothetical protein